MAERTTRETLFEHAHEHAQIKVSALLQAFALPQVDEAIIERLLNDAVATSYTAGFAEGFDAALDEATTAITQIHRFRPLDDR